MTIRALLLNINCPMSDWTSDLEMPGLPGMKWWFECAKNAKNNNSDNFGPS